MNSEADISDSYLNVLKEQELCDVTFVVGSNNNNKEKISCHKIFLAARSPVFKTMFTERWDTGRAIELPDVEPRIFHIFLQYLYAGRTSEGVSLDLSDFDMLLYLAEKYDVTDLLNKFKEMLKFRFNIPNIITVHYLADKYNFFGLRYDAAEFMIRKFWKLMLDPSFALMDVNLLEMCVLERSHLVPEIDVFIGLMKWAEARCEEASLEATGKNKRQALGNIFSLLQFGRIAVLDFDYYVVPSEVLTTKEVFLVSKDRSPGPGSRAKGALPTSLKVGDVNSDIPWTRGTSRNMTDSRPRSELLQVYFDSVPDN